VLVAQAAQPGLDMMGQMVVIPFLAASPPWAAAVAAARITEQDYQAALAVAAAMPTVPGVLVRLTKDTQAEHLLVEAGAAAAALVLLVKLQPRTLKEETAAMAFHP
jgi:hypothetical protein